MKKLVFTLVAQWWVSAHWQTFSIDTVGSSDLFAGHLKRIVGTCDQWPKPPHLYEIWPTVCWLLDDET